MNEKEINITIPEGYEIDKEKSTFERVVFKRIESPKWRDDGTQVVHGFYISSIKSAIREFKGLNHSDNYNLFATEKQAKSSLAMARIAQIMANDERFGGIITDEEWKDGTITKHVISRYGKEIRLQLWNACYHFLAFHTHEQCELFLEENGDLVRDYLMIE